MLGQISQTSQRRTFQDGWCETEINKFQLDNCIIKSNFLQKCQQNYNSIPKTEFLRRVLATVQSPQWRHQIQARRWLQNWWRQRWPSACLRVLDCDTDHTAALDIIQQSFLELTMIMILAMILFMFLLPKAGQLNKKQLCAY